MDRILELITISFYDLLSIIYPGKKIYTAAVIISHTIIIILYVSAITPVKQPKTNVLWNLLLTIKYGDKKH